MILVTGATGRIGTSAIRQLRERDLPVRALGGRHAHRAPRDAGVEWIEGDLADERAVTAGLRGVRTVVLLSASAPQRVRLQERVIDLAEAAGVARIVKLSTVAAAEDASCDSARWHWRVERRLARSSLEHCTLRATRVMQELLQQVPLLLTSGLLAGCQGDGRVADVDARDVGHVLASLAASDRAPDPELHVTGPEAMSFATLAAHLTRQLGRPVRYVDCTPADLLLCAEAAGVEPWRAHDMVAWQTEARAGRYAIVHDTIERITGRTPRRFESFANELATSLRYANAPAATRPLASLPDHGSGG